MRCLGVMCSLAALCLVTVAPQSSFGQYAAPASELRGKWVLTSMQVDGKIQVYNNSNPFYLSFAGNRCLFGNVEGAYQIRLDRQPKEIDLTLADKNGRPYSVPGIFEITGDTLTICMPGANWTRPTELRSNAGDGKRLYRFTLMPAAEPANPSLPPNPKSGGIRQRGKQPSVEQPPYDIPPSCGCGSKCTCNLAGSDTLSKTMRKLWEDHITWTRNFIISALAGLPDRSAVTTRLLRNQDDIGNAIKPYYGDAAGAKLTALLKQHILISADVVDAAKAGDTAKQNAATKRWYANADEIAAFLNSANPKYWPLEEMRAMFYEHLQLTTAEALARLRMDWPGDVAAYDRVHNQILMMADMLSSGIAKQFPNQLRGSPTR